MSVVVVGIPVASTNSFSSGAASRQPPPAYTTGRFERLIMSKTCCICGDVGGDGSRDRYPFSETFGPQNWIDICCCTSFGMSISTRPGPPAGREEERLAHDPRDVLHVHDEVVVLRDLPRDLHGGRLLEGVRADHPSRD